MKGTLLTPVFIQKASGWFSRLALFVIFFWFGILKVIGHSPASSLVSDLLQKTLPFLSAQQFTPVFGWYEVTIGLLFLIPRLEKLAITLLIPHLIMTFLPLVLLSKISWQSYLVPTLEGQYIIKNLLIAALVLSFYTRIKSVK